MLMILAKKRFVFCFMKMSTVKGARDKKAWFQTNFFLFQIFEIFENLAIEFTINLNKYLWKIINNVIKCLWKFKIATQWKKNRFEVSLWHVSLASWGFIVQTHGDSELYRPKKALLHVIKTYYFEHVLN